MQRWYRSSSWDLLVQNVTNISVFGLSIFGRYVYSLFPPSAQSQLTVKPQSGNPDSTFCNLLRFKYIWTIDQGLPLLLSSPNPALLWVVDGTVAMTMWPYLRAWLPVLTPTWSMCRDCLPVLFDRLYFSLGSFSIYWRILNTEKLVLVWIPEEHQNRKFGPQDTINLGPQCLNMV